MTYLYKKSRNFEDYEIDRKIMKKAILGIVSVMALLVAVTGCKNGIAGGASSYADSVVIKKVVVADTSSFALTAGGQCAVNVMANINYPDYYVDADATGQLRQLFARYVLNAADTIDFNDAFTAYVKTVLAQYGISEDETIDHVESDYVSVYSYDNNTDIGVVYNGNNVLGICRAEEVKKNGATTMLTHRYYNFDLKNMTLIGVDNLFSEAVIDDVAQMIKEKLMKQNNVKSEEDLINLGFFNLDNLKVTDNFYFTDNSVVWSYVPYEIALYSVGETEVELSFDEIDDYLVEDSPVYYIN